MNPNNDTPSIRFAGFTDAWEQRKLGELCSITTGRLDANAMIDGGKYDFYTSGVEKYRIDVAAFEGPAITIAGNGANVGYLHLADGKFNAYQRTYVLTDFQADRQFLSSVIGQALPLKIQEEVRGSGIPYIVMDMLTELSVPLPKEGEQSKVGQLFKEVDTLITLHQRKYDQLVNIKKSMLEKMFPKNGEQVPEVRFAGFTDAWEQRKLETICSISSGANTAHEEDGKYFNLTMGSVSEDGQIMYSLKTNETSRLLSKGQLIMPTRDVGKGLIIGRTAYVPEDNRFYAGNCLYILTVNADLDSKFLSYFINSNYVRQQFARVVSGGGQKQITLTDVSELTISLPKSEEEQKQISAIFENLDTLITLHQRKLERLQNIKKACLEKMFV